MNAVQNGYRLFLIEIIAAGFLKRKEFALGTVPQVNYSTTPNVYN